jgi:hypothetical protein
MYLQGQRENRRGIQCLLALVVSMLLMPVFHANADGMPAGKAGMPKAFKEYHVHYDVNADGTYTETGEIEMSVLNQQGVLRSKNMPVGMRNSAMGKKRDVEILSAYTLKKNGEHIQAIQSGPADAAGAGASDPAQMPAYIRTQLKFVTFQQVEVGDTLVYSYKVIQQEAMAPPHNVVLNEYFPKYMAYDDAVVSLTAPAFLHLRIATVGVGKAEDSSTTDTQKLVWKYQNKQPEPIAAGADPRSQPPSSATPRIHISSFQDDNAEREAFQAHAPTMAFFPVSQKNKGCNVPEGYPSDGPDAKQTYSDLVAEYFWHNEASLDGIASAWMNPECVWDDGRPMLTALDVGYGTAYQGQPDWSISLSRVNDLKKKFPGKAFVALAEAEYWVNYAQSARGGGFASSVTPYGWQLFKERLEKAEKVLNDSRSYAAQMPGWYDDMITVQSALDDPAEERDKTFLEGARKFKIYYPIYFTMLNFLTPKWGGSWDAVDKLVEWSVDNTKETEGNSMYARLYWSASVDFPPGSRFFKETHVSWPKMKQGFEDLMARHPKSKWNLNNFARFACLANDQSTFLALRNQMGKAVMLPAWSSKALLERCETKFGYSQ